MHPFSQDPGVIYVTPGQSIRQMLDQAAGGAELAVGEMTIRDYGSLEG